MDIQALVLLWNLTQQHPGTSGACAALGVLLGLYNGSRFPMDLTDLRRLDAKHLAAAMSVISHDASSCQMEVHEWLNQVAGRRDFGPRLESLAWDYRRRRRTTKDNLSSFSPPQIILAWD